MRTFHCYLYSSLFFKITERGDSALVLCNHPPVVSVDRVIQLGKYCDYNSYHSHVAALQLDKNNLYSITPEVPCVIILSYPRIVYLHYIHIDIILLL